MPREYDFGRGDDPLDTPEVEPVRQHRGEGFYASPPEQVLGGEQDYDEMTKAELVALADERGVDSSGTKAEIAAALRGE